MENKMIKKTRHKWANIYKYKAHHCIENKDGTFTEISINGYSHFKMGKPYKTKEECFKAAKKSMNRFMRDCVEFM